MPKNTTIPIVNGDILFQTEHPHGESMKKRKINVYC